MSDVLKQSDRPLYPKVLWNRPINRAAGGRLVVVGGQSQHFNSVQQVYQAAMAAGIGSCTVVLPDSLKKLLGDVPNSRFVPSTPAGSLAKAALAEIIDSSRDCDGVILGPDLTNNSETMVLVELLVSRLRSRVIISQQALQAIKFNSDLARSERPSLIVLSSQELFQLSGWLDVAITIKAAETVLNKLEIVRNVAAASRADFLLQDRDITVSAGRRLSLTATDRQPLGPLAIGLAATFWIQNRSNPFAGLTTAAYLLAQVTRSTGSDTQAAVKTLTALINQN